MKKFFLSFVFFFSFVPTLTCEPSTYFKTFEIYNGTINMPYDKYNNYYTVYIPQEETFLDFGYELEDEEASVTIIGNDYFLADTNEVKITIYDSEDIESTTYTFLVEKYKEEEVSALDTGMTDLFILGGKVHIESVITMIATLFVFILFIVFF